VTRRTASLYLAIALALTPGARAQDVTQRAALSIAGTVAGTNGVPLPFSTASIRENGAERFSDERGEFVLGNLSPGTYHLRVKQLGFAAFDTTVMVSALGLPVHLRVVLKPIAFRLETVTIRGTRACVVADREMSADGSDFETLLGELRKNAERERLLTTSYPFEYRVAKFFDSSDPNPPSKFRGSDTVTYRSDARPRYHPGGIVRVDEGIPPPNNRIMVIPVLGDLGDPEFLATHCFIYVGEVPDGRAKTHRIDFKPTAKISEPDIEGSVYLDTESFVIRRAVFRLTRAAMLTPPVRSLEVTSSYREILPGVAVVQDVRAVQEVNRELFSSRSIRLIERQRLVDFHFLQGQPGDTARIQ
jgi:CarboxypepD_reg-like domain